MSLRIERFCNSSYERTVRWSLIAACLLVLGLAVGGCYTPQVKNGGFACIATDDPPCPKGYFCVGGFCVDNPALVVPDDMTVLGDMSFPINDFSAGPDIAKVQDLASTMADLATGGSCGMSGDQCVTQSCCPGAVCFLISCI
ncbi:MAG: hypothetical protein JWN44_3058 [Myxococcales bacterium]|nr:hypothetical protein [Myxococcales bacterium]